MMILQQILFTSLVLLQVIGPAWFVVLQAPEAFAQETSQSQALVAGLGGIVTVIPVNKANTGFTPKYRSILSVGDLITTEEESVAELLLDNKGLIAIQEYSEAVITREDDGSLSAALHLGEAEWSLPTQGSGSIPLVFSTPNIRTTTQGGLWT